MNPILATDSYKLSHKEFQKEGVIQIYSNFTPRFNHHFLSSYPDADNKVVWFGLQATLKQVFVEYWQKNFFDKSKTEVIEEAKSILEPYIGMTDLSHFEELHDLGYLPLHVKALTEGSLIDIGVPLFTITNTHPNFAWLTNFLESFLTTQLWKSVVVATIGRQFKILSDKFALETLGSIEGTEFQNHDFSFRGQSGIDSSAAVGAAFLLSSKGTDNVSALQFIQKYYNTDITKYPVAHSVKASEHSVASLGVHTSLTKGTLLDKEEEYLSYILDKMPLGIISYVSDTYDYYGVLKSVVPNLKEKILARDGKLVLRPDSSDPTTVIAGIEIQDYSHIENFNIASEMAVANQELKHSEFNPKASSKNKDYELVFAYKGSYFRTVYKVNYKTSGYLSHLTKVSVVKTELSVEEKGTVEHLWDIFGGTVSDQGYKVLDSHIGVIYGDSITYQRAKEILTRLEEKGFASSNIVFGIGAFSISAMISRDTLGMAFKATMAQLEDNSYLPIYKDPKTDTSKKSAKGFLKVVQESGVYSLEDNVSKEEETLGELKTVFKDGVLYDTLDFETIRDNLWHSQVPTS